MLGFAPVFAFDLDPFLCPPLSAAKKPLTLSSPSLLPLSDFYLRPSAVKNL